MSAEDNALREMNAAAERILSVIRLASPGVDNSHLARAMAIATGMALAESAFPQQPPREIFMAVGVLVGHGVKVGIEVRTKLEKETCKGAA